MGNSDPLPAGFEIRFGSLNFQATGNGYLMRITNRDELRARWPTGPGPAPTAPVADALVSAHADAAGPPAPRHRQRSGQRSRKAQTERRWAARVTSQRNTIASETTTAPTRGGGCDFRATVPPRLARHHSGACRQHRHGSARGPPRSPRLSGWEPRHHHRRRVVPRLHQRAATCHFARVRGVGLVGAECSPNTN
jgi:hypothetical protein